MERHSGGENLFLWVELFDPHEPWDPPLELKEQYNPGYEGQEIIDPVPSEVEGYLTPEEIANVRALYAGEVSFVDRWIGRLPGAEAGKRRQALVRLSDIAPTICDAAGVAPMPNIHGTSLLPLVRGEVASVRDYAISGIHCLSAAIRDGKWSLLLPGADGHELYDRESDPCEQVNLIARYPDEARRLEGQFRRELEALE